MSLRGLPLAALFVAAFSAIFVYYLNEKSPDLRYSLSERIPVSFATNDGKVIENKTQEVVQQLEVRNVGNLKAENILVKIHGDITGHFLNKHSATDESKITIQPRTFEVQYPALPPGASFQLSFKTIGDGVATQQVAVSDSSGKAQEALSKASPSLSSYTSWLFIAINTVLTVVSIRWILISSWKMKLGDKPLATVVSSTTPFYMAERGRIDAVRIEVKDRLRSGYVIGHDISKHPAYVFLQLDRPDTFSDEEEWKTCTELAIEKLTTAYRDALRGLFWKDGFLKLLAIGRPKHFPEPQWLELEVETNGRYVDRRKQESSSSDAILKCLQEVRPELIAPASWQELIDHWQKAYFSERTRWINYKSNVAKCLREQQPDVIPSAIWSEIREIWEREFFAQVMHEVWITSDPVTYASHVDAGVLSQRNKAAFEERVRELVSRKSAEARANRLIAILQKLLTSRTISDAKPADIEQHVWEDLKRLETDFSRLRDMEYTAQSTSLLEAELAAKEATLQASTEKVKRQLQIIHDVLNDPSAIDRVEEYDDAFAKGNLENLKKLLTLGSKRRRDSTKGTS